MSRLSRMYYTLRPLKAAQWWYRLAHPLLKRLAAPHTAQDADIAAATVFAAMPLAALPAYRRYSPETREFSFLNRCKAFPDAIDWRFADYGLLWTYNLHYFEWLYDEQLPVAARLDTITAYTQAPTASGVGRDGYPLSLRIVAWARFLAGWGIKDEAILKRLYSDAVWLLRFPEYALQGNHLWENAIALLYAGYFFRNETFYKKGKRLLRHCLKEQLFEDGGHTEGSPMYHSLLLWRLLQCVELARAAVFPQADDGLLQQMEAAAGSMLGWLQAVTFSDGSWPAVNDSTVGIAPSTKDLSDYAALLQILPVRHPLSDSRYRMIPTGPFELFIDAADQSHAHQPGHAHADTGTFCLHAGGRPLIVDTGISTYEPTPLRLSQRGTAAHNTVSVGGKNSGDVWRSFRLGRRARVTAFEEKQHGITIAHDGYQSCGIIHRRRFFWNGDCIRITDELEGDTTDEMVLHIHFHPGVAVLQTGPNHFIAGKYSIRFSGDVSASCITYECGAGFNRLQPALCIKVIIYRRQVETIIEVTG